MRGLARFGLTVGALALSALFIAVIAADITIEAYDEPGVAGKFAVQFALGFAVILGWAFGASVEQLWREDGDWGDVLLAGVFRLFAGAFLFFPIIGAEIGFEALGVGLGAHS